MSIRTAIKRCHICIDPNCGGKQNCNCLSCNKKETCYRELRPTIRITLACTQSCSHCCFECSPKETTHMLIDKAIAINFFCKSNEITLLNVMGGEFFMNPNWIEVLSILAEGMEDIRLVTNGDWAGLPVANDVITFLKNNSIFRLGISRDKWHTNKHVQAAIDLCEQNHIVCRVASEEESDDQALVPIGRADLSYNNLYSFMSCYCCKPDRKYQFLIDEEGDIFKCGFGTWKYANVVDYLTGGFSVRFKEFNNKFYSAFISSCASCKRIESSRNSKKE